MRSVPYYDLPAEAGLVTPDGHAVQVHISLAGDTLNEQLINYDEIEPMLHADGLETDLAGLYPAHADVNVITEEDLKRAELLSLPLVVLLALLIFGSLTASAMPALLGIIALLTSIAVMRLLTLFTDVSMFSINVISLLGIGLAVDYSLFIVSRFREELALLPPDDPASPRHRRRAHARDRRSHGDVLRAWSWPRRCRACWCSPRSSSRAWGTAASRRS